MRRVASAATAASSSTTTTCAPSTRNSWTDASATDQPHRTDQRVLEDPVEPRRIERLGDERRLIERLETARAARHLRTVPVGRGEQVIGLAGDPCAHCRAWPDRLDVHSDERACRAL